MKTFLGIVAVCGCLLFGCQKNSTDPGMSEGTLRVAVGNGAVLNLAKGQSPAPVYLDSVKLLISRIEVENADDDSIDFVSRMPMLVSVGMDSMRYIGLVGIPFGVYEKVEAQIDSVYAWGYVGLDSTQKFQYASRTWIEYEKELYPTASVGPDSPTLNLMLYVDTSMWFYDWRGGYVDPRLPVNKQRIDSNIRQSFFIDCDDGDDDADDDDGD